MVMTYTPESPINHLCTQLSGGIVFTIYENVIAAIGGREKVDS